MSYLNSESLFARLADEFVVRLRSGESPTIEEYARLFPSISSKIREQFPALRLHAESTRPSNRRTEVAMAITEGQLPSTGNFVGSDRFELAQKLGSGGMGVVYEAIDHSSNNRVALKFLANATPSALVQFKREFRLLSELSHPNLVSLYELFAQEQNWFFTMELVDGYNFYDWLKSQLRDGYEGIAGDTSDAGQVDLAGAKPLYHAGYDRQLRRAFCELAMAIEYLHSQGRLHRDIKFSNVMVRKNGKPVLLDFGLVCEPDFSHSPMRLGANQESVASETLSIVAGTPLFMAPEQAAGKELSVACDWYALGVMLYESLTGNMPFVGPRYEMLQRKQFEDPTPPSHFNPDLPSDLCELTLRLLNRDPLMRPRGDEVCGILGQTSQVWSGSVTHGWDCDSYGECVSVPERSWHGKDSCDDVFVGRGDPLTRLQESLERVAAGQPTLVVIHGPSGLGKSALVREFTNQLRRDEGATVFRGKCNERESLPFKALDEAVDAIGSYMLRLPADEVNALIPPGFSLLSRVFPVFQSVLEHSTICYAETDQSEDGEARRRAFQSLWELLLRISRDKPLVICIDDLHWADDDSLSMLADLLAMRFPPKLLLIVTARQELGEKTGRLIESVQGADARSRFQVQKLSLQPLSFAESCELAQSYLSVHTNSQHDPALANSIARASEGHPYFIQELVRRTTNHEFLTDEQNQPTHLNLDESLWAHVASLPLPERRLIEVVSISVRPLSLRIAQKLCGDVGLTEQSITVTRHERLVKIGSLGRQTVLTPYHDRIRESVVAHLPVETRRQLHSKLAFELESANAYEPEQLALHLQYGGQPQRAAYYYSVAAQAAVDSLAFKHAADLYRLAIELKSISSESTAELVSGAEHTLPPVRIAERQLLQQRLADALASAGHGGEAAVEYLNAAAGQSADIQLRLHRLAARQYSIGGYTDEGRKLFREILRDRSIPMYSNPTAILLSLLHQRLRLSVKGLKKNQFVHGEENERRLETIDLLWDAVSGLSFQEPMVVASLHTRGLLLALQAGEPKRLARSMALEAAICATSGVKGERQVESLMSAASQLADGLNDSYTAAMLQLTRGMCRFLFVQMPEAVELMLQAESTFASRPTKVWWELATARSMIVWAFMHIGDYERLEERVATYTQDAQSRGDRFLLTSIGSAGRPQLLLAADQPDLAKQELEELIRRYPYEKFQQQHVSLLYSQAYVDLYLNNGLEAWLRFRKSWTGLRRSLQLKNQFARVTMLELRARSALQALRLIRAGEIQVDVSQSTAMRADVYQIVERLKREKTEWIEPFIHRICAGLAELDGDVALAIQELILAQSGFSKIGFQAASAVCKRRLGQISGGDHGWRLVDEAEKQICSQGVVRLDRFQTSFLY